MKKIFLLLLLIGTLAVSSSAQKAQPSKTESTAALFKRLTNEYKLNAEQVKKLDSILKKKEKNMAEIAPMQATDPKGFAIKYNSVLRITNKAIKKMLTPDQLAVYAEKEKKNNAKKSEMAAKMKETNTSKEEMNLIMSAEFEQ